MEVGVLGSTVVEGAGGPAPVLARKPRALLAALALSPGRTVTADRLVDLVWGAHAPTGAYGTMHAYISGLRRVLEPDLAPRARPTVLVTTDDGYRLDLDPDSVDAVAFGAEVRRCHAGLAPLWSQLTTGRSPRWPSTDSVVEHVDSLDHALGRWRGAAYADLGDHPDVLAERAALDEQRATAQEDLHLALLALGEHATVVAACEQTVARQPLRERVRCLQALALVRSGRQADALEALRRYRRHIDDELGLEPGPEIRALEQAVLRQDRALLETLVRPSEHLVAVPAPQGLPEAGGPGRTVGREREAAAVRDALGSAVAGDPRSLLVVGDPGMGKTRLVQDAVALAEELGMATAVARCSHDDGAPPLWPWYRVLAALGLQTPAVLGHQHLGDDLPEPQHAFAVQDALADAVRRRAAEQPVLVVVEDLHWADTRTLRALAHLAAALEPGDRVALLLTRRARPEPTGALLDLDAVLARHASGTLELAGLGRADARRLVESLSDTAGQAAPVDTWWEHTGGNPFFLVELARLGLSRGVWQDAVPTSVRAVVAERLEALPEPTREVLLLSAALGREHSPLLLARVSERTPEELLDLLDPAARHGVVHVRPDGRVAFEHALTRDAVLAVAAPGAVTRAHARVAQALASTPSAELSEAERTFELAHHWLAAGAVHAASAWRAAATAAVEARRESANVEAAALYRAALASHALDPAATRADRYALLVDLAEVASRAAHWWVVVDAVTEAVRLAQADDDPHRVAAAAAELTRYNIWLPQPYLHVADDLVEDLRGALRAAGPHDSATRCRLMLALAVQLYYAPGYEPEIEALVDEGLAVARRLGDPVLRGWAARTGWLALWRPRHLERRLELAHEEIEAALECGDQAAEAVARAALAGAAVEGADLDTWTEEAAAAETIARRRRLPFVEFALSMVRLSLALMAGRVPEAEVLDRRLREMLGEVTTPADDSLDSALAFAAASWRPEATGVVAEAVRQAHLADPGPFLRVSVVFLLARAGRLEDAREQLAGDPLPAVPDMWHATMEAAERADAAGLLGDSGLAAQSLGMLRETSGRMAVAGVSIGAGPVDGYLAVALAVLGESERATAAAARAEALASAWGLTAYLEWLDGRRRALGF